MFQHPDQRVGVFIDTQNMYYSARNLFKRKVNFKNIVDDAVAGRKLIRAIAYVVSTEGGEEKPFFEALKKAGIQTRAKNLMIYLSGAKKADWDVGLAIDVVQMLDTLDVVVLVTGDGDFQPLVNYVQSRGRMVELMSFRETTSSSLIEMVQNYTDLSANKRKYLIGPKIGGEQTQENETEEEQEVYEINNADTGGFFMETPSNEQDDQEENRSRRLEF
jgi:uncharacterized LabA/DUF88 family protein